MTQEKSVEFDEQAAREEWCSDKYEVDDYNNFIHGARWQHAQSAKKIVELEAENKRLRDCLIEFADLENPNTPERVCWPGSNYMKKAREALKEVK